MFGQDPGQSSLIEVRMVSLHKILVSVLSISRKTIYSISLLPQGFTAGGFIYIAVAGVLAEMNSSSSTLKSTTIQLLSLMTGMAVALWISLVE